MTYFNGFISIFFYFQTNSTSTSYFSLGSNCHCEAGVEYKSPKLFLITPTYRRLLHKNFVLNSRIFFRNEQEAELTRLGQTLLLVKNFVWIIVEDSKVVTNRLKNILQKFQSINIIIIAGFIKKNN